MWRRSCIQVATRGWVKPGNHTCIFETKSCILICSITWRLKKSIPWIPLCYSWKHVEKLDPHISRQQTAFIPCTCNMQQRHRARYDDQSRQMHVRKTMTQGKIDHAYQNVEDNAACGNIGIQHALRTLIWKKHAGIIGLIFLQSSVSSLLKLNIHTVELYAHLILLAAYTTKRQECDSITNDHTGKCTSKSM